MVRGNIRDYCGEHPAFADLVIEAADISMPFDTVPKASCYAQFGIPDYWVLDIDGKRLLVFFDPAPLPAGLGATAYRTHRILNPSDRISPLAAPGSSILVADLLP